MLLVCGLTGWVNHRRRPEAGGAAGKDRKAPAWSVDRLWRVLGISESEYVARFASPTQTDWVMTCTPAEGAEDGRAGAGHAAAGEARGVSRRRF